MAQRQIIQRIDDIDGTAIADGDGRTVSFALDGTAYEIDLSDAHTQELTDALAPFVSAGRRTGRKAVSTATKSNPAELQKIREWARSQGHDVSDRGRVSGTIRDAYNAAH